MELHTLKIISKVLSIAALLTEILDQIMELNKKRKEMITQAETAKANQNKLSGEIGKLKREGKDASAILSEVDVLKSQVKELEAKAAEADQQVLDLALVIPNKPHASVPKRLF